MLNIADLRQLNPQILVIGLHPNLIQSILDFDYYAGKKQPSIVGIMAGGKKFVKFFWGKKEILMPIYSDFKQFDTGTINLVFSIASGRRTFFTLKKIGENLPNLKGGVIFAEGVPEKHALELKQIFNARDQFLIGPASVGLLIPGKLKLGPIGGTISSQLLQAQVLTSGHTAVISASGGMTNEMINFLAQNDLHLSFALAMGGDRFPITTPAEAFLLAENDPKTKQIVYYGELGGDDEYQIAKLIREKKITKKIIAYIGGSISQMFKKPPQFGHAKAMAKTENETALAKSKMLKDVGVNATNSYQEFMQAIQNLDKDNSEDKKYPDLINRKHSMFTSSISGEKDGEIQILGQSLNDFVKNGTIASNLISLLLGKKVKSQALIDFVDITFKILMDHSPQVSGGVNTIISARAGKDLVSSLASGILTIGPRFGGAISKSAKIWFDSVSNNISADNLVESFAKNKQYLSGIGHKKYSLDNPDPRLQLFDLVLEKLSKTPHYDYARQVEKVTTAKKRNLILNVDGMIGAVMLDILLFEEQLSEKEVANLIDIEFFNALFVLSRSIGFTAHYLDQKRLDEGLFRLPSQEMLLIE